MRGMRGMRDIPPQHSRALAPGSKGWETVPRGEWAFAGGVPLHSRPWREVPSAAEEDVSHPLIPLIRFNPPFWMPVTPARLTPREVLRGRFRVRSCRVIRVRTDATTAPGRARPAIERSAEGAVGAYAATATAVTAEAGLSFRERYRMTGRGAGGPAAVSCRRATER